VIVQVVQIIFPCWLFSNHEAMKATSLYVPQKLARAFYFQNLTPKLNYCRYRAGQFFGCLLVSEFRDVLLPLWDMNTHQAPLPLLFCLTLAPIKIPHFLPGFIHGQGTGTPFSAVHTYFVGLFTICLGYFLNKMRDIPYWHITL